MTRKTLWAIRHKATGHYLPDVPFIMGRRLGTTRVDPVDPSMKHPRLFKDERCAKLGLVHWLRGIQKWDEVSGKSLVQMSERRCEDMEVVAVEVVLP